MQDEQLIEGQENLLFLQSYAVADLARTADFGEQLSFNEIVSSAQYIVDMLNRLPIEHIKAIPDNKFRNLLKQLASIRKTFTDIEEFKAEGNDWEPKRKQLINTFPSHHQSLYDCLGDILPHVNSDRLASAHISEIGKEASTILVDVRRAQADANNALSEIRKGLTETGFSQEASVFSDEAKGHRKDAFLWLVAAIGFALALIVLSLLSVKLPDWLGVNLQNVGEAAAYISGKLLLFGTLTVGLVFCGRNVMASRHNAVVNKHRQNALQTYRALVEGGMKPETQDIVLNHAAASIYGAQDTGYTKHAQAVSQTTNPAFEVIQRILPTDSR